MTDVVTAPPEEQKAPPKDEVEVSALVVEETDKSGVTARKYQIKWYYLETRKGLPMLESQFGAKFYVAKDIYHAAEEGAAYIQWLAETEPTEFAAIVGDDAALVAWAYGQPAKIGEDTFNDIHEFVDSFGDIRGTKFVDLYLFANNKPCNVVRISDDLVKQLGFTPTIAYRWD